VGEKGARAGGTNRQRDGAERTARRLCVGRLVRCSLAPVSRGDRRHVVRATDDGPQHGKRDGLHSGVSAGANRPPLLARDRADPPHRDGRRLQPQPGAWSGERHERNERHESGGRAATRCRGLLIAAVTRHTARSFTPHCGTAKCPVSRKGASPKGGVRGTGTSRSARHDTEPRAPAKGTVGTFGTVDPVGPVTTPTCEGESRPQVIAIRPRGT